MAVFLHLRKPYVVETNLNLPDEFVPARGAYIHHDIFNGLMPIGAVFYDARPLRSDDPNVPTKPARNILVVGMDGAAYDFSVTLDEWLAERGHWYKPDVEFIELQKIPEPDADAS